MRETARSAHVWDKSWETALAVLQEGLEEIPGNRIAQGVPPVSFLHGFRLQFCLEARVVERGNSTRGTAEAVPLVPRAGLNASVATVC